MLYDSSHWLLGKKEKRTGINNENNLKINGRRIEFIGPKKRKIKFTASAFRNHIWEVWAFASIVEKSVQSVFIVLPVRFVFCFPARSDRFHLIVDKYRPGTRERGRGREGWREDRRGKSNMVDGKLLSNKIPRIYGERSGNDLPGRQNSLSTSGKSITSLSSPPRPVSSLFPLRIDWHRGLSHK